MPKILDLRFLSQDIIESKLDKDGNSKSYIIERINNKEHEISLKEGRNIAYTIDGNMKILNLQNIEVIEGINNNIVSYELSDYTVIFFFKIKIIDKYIFIGKNKKKELFIDGKKTTKENIEDYQYFDELLDFVTKNENFYNLQNLYNIQIYDETLSEEKMMEIYEELQKDVSIHRQKELEMTDRKIKLLIQYNETNKEIERLTNNKEKILEKANKHDKILKARELVRQRVEFNKKWIHYLMTTSKVVHIILVIIIIVMIIYKVY